MSEAVSLFEAVSPSDAGPAAGASLAGAGELLDAAGSGGAASLAGAGALPNAPWLRNSAMLPNSLRGPGSTSVAFALNASVIASPVTVTGASSGKPTAGCCAAITISGGNVNARTAARAIHTPITASGHRTTKLPNRWKMPPAPATSVAADRLR